MAANLVGMTLGKRILEKHPWKIGPPEIRSTENGPPGLANGEKGSQK